MVGPILLYYLVRANVLAALAVMWFRYILGNPPRWLGSLLVALFFSLIALLVILYAIVVDLVFIVTALM